jgi:hypothetical protein
MFFAEQISVAEPDCMLEEMQSGRTYCPAAAAAATAQRGDGPNLATDKPVV